MIHILPKYKPFSNYIKHVLHQIRGLDNPKSIRQQPVDLYGGVTFFEKKIFSLRFSPKKIISLLDESKTSIPLKRDGRYMLLFTAEGFTPTGNALYYM